MEEIRERLEQAAFKVTESFCFYCFRMVRDDPCPNCRSDGLMRHLPGVGVRYGIEWVIEHILETRLTPVDGEKMYEELLDECYPEVKIGCCTFSPSQVMKELDPIAFEIGVQENLDGIVDYGQLYEYGGKYYNVKDIGKMLDEIEAK